VLREGAPFASRAARSHSMAIAGVTLIAAAAAVGPRAPILEFPVLGYVSAVLLIAGFALLVPVFSRLMLAVLSPTMQRLFPIEGRLAAQSMRSGVSRIGTAVLSLGIAVAMLVSVVTMVSSFRETVMVWINQTLRADLYIRAGAAGTNDWSNAFDPDTVSALS